MEAIREMTKQENRSSAEGARRASGAEDRWPFDEPPDPEVPERPERRRFTAEYKMKILAEADACETHGEIGALLRREGLYSSHLSRWRQRQRAGALGALKPKKRGPEPDPVVPFKKRINEHKGDGKNSIISCKYQILRESTSSSAADWKRSAIIAG